MQTIQFHLGCFYLYSRIELYWKMNVMLARDHLALGMVDYCIWLSQWLVTYVYWSISWVPIDLAFYLLFPGFWGWRTLILYSLQYHERTSSFQDFLIFYTFLSLCCNFCSTNSLSISWHWLSLSSLPTLCLCC